MKNIRKAEIQDISRLAEILVFTKRINYRNIFHNDKFSFGEMQVMTVAQEYIENTDKLNNIWIYDDGIVKGMINIEGEEIRELYVDSFFQNQGIGAKLINFSIQEFKVKYLWVLEKNEKAIKFYQTHGFKLSKETIKEEGTTEFSVKMIHKL